MEIRSFLKQGAAFAAPVVLWVAFVVCVDPFDYFNLFPGADDLKSANVAPLNSMMFNMLKERNNPHENVIIGDSRIENLSLPQINAVSGLEFGRLSANALKLNEALDLFWFAHRLKPLRHVVFGINFNMYNEFAFADREQSVEAMIHNPLLYVFDRSVAQAAFSVVRASITKCSPVNSRPPMTRDEFWSYIVRVRGREHYSRFRHPDGIYERLRNLAEFGKSNHVDLTIIIVPHSREFQSRVREFGLVDEYIRFKRELSTLGVKVIDYDYLNEITAHRENFRDPIHCNESISELIVDEVFGDKLKFGRVLDAKSPGECLDFLF
jgi:hypothetical protein